MGIRNSMLGSGASSVNKYIGTSYDVVKTVYDNLDFLKSIDEDLEDLAKYLGTGITPPTTRLDGSPIQGGDYYLDTGLNLIRYYNSTDDIWINDLPPSILEAAEEAKVSAAQAALSEANAASSATIASNAEVSAVTASGLADASAVSSAADAAQTAADRIATGEDVISTSANATLAQETIDTGVQDIQDISDSTAIPTIQIAENLIEMQNLIVTLHPLS